MRQCAQISASKSCARSANVIVAIQATPHLAPYMKTPYSRLIPVVAILALLGAKAVGCFFRSCQF
jgi:hypothetical protein